MTAASSLRTVALDQGEVVYDSDMKMGALRGINAASRAGDLDSLITAFSKVVASWPFKGEPSDPESWDGLRRSEFNALLTAVTEDLGSLGEA